MGQGKKVTVSDSSGIDSVKAGAFSHDAIYDLYGRKVSDVKVLDDIKTLSSGIYIKLNNSAVSKIVIPFK